MTTRPDPLRLLLVGGRAVVQDGALSTMDDTAVAAALAKAARTLREGR